MLRIPAMRRTTLPGYLAVLGASLLASLLASACASGSKDLEKTQPPPISEQGMKNELSDGQIVGVVRALNEGEVEMGEMAKMTAAAQPARDFANMMVMDHSAADQTLSDLSQRLGIVPAESDLSTDMRKKHQAAMDELRRKTGADFDKEYATMMVNGHEQALRIIDDKLLPNAKNAELGALLREIRVKVAEHLSHARQLKEMPVAER